MGRDPRSVAHSGLRRRGQWQNCHLAPITVDSEGEKSRGRRQITVGGKVSLKATSNNLPQIVTD